MRKKISVSRGAALVLGGAVLAVSGQAHAANPACPTGSTVVYVSGSSAFQPVLQAAQNALGSTVQIVYQSPGSCEGLLYLVGDNGASVPPDADAAVLLAPNVVAAGCSLPMVGAVQEATVDIGVSDVYPTTCSAFDSNLNTVGSATGTKDFLGPVQAMTIAVPTGSTRYSISAEAAYMVFKYGGGAPAIAPWNNTADVFTRYYDSGTQELIGAGLGDGTKTLPGGNWLNATCNPKTTTCPQTASGAGNMVTKLTGRPAGEADSVIGILGNQNIPTGNTIRPLSFQAHGQSCGYLPDSALGANDKINVRQGRYALWGPEHMVVNVDGSGNPVGMNSNTTAVVTLINALNSTSLAPASASVDGGTTLDDAQVGAIIDAISAPPAGFIAGVVPQCAMQVQRSAEVGAEASYQPPAACSCRFLAAATGTATGCTACTSANASTVCTGSTPACHYGYCEAQ